VSTWARILTFFLDRFAHLLHLSSNAVDIYNIDMHDFEYVDGESFLTASLLLHEMIT